MLVLRLKPVDDLPARVLGVDSGLHICSRGFRRASLLLSNTSDVRLPQIGFSCRNRNCWAQRCPCPSLPNRWKMFIWPENQIAFECKYHQHNSNKINWDYFNNPRLPLSKINQFTVNVCLHLDDVIPWRHSTPLCWPYNKIYTKN